MALLHYTDKDRQQIYKDLNINDQAIKRDIETIKEWFKQQPHLPEIPSNNLIELFLLANKNSIEKTKVKLDMYYTIRSLLPEFYVNTNPRLAHMRAQFDTTYSVPLPQLTDKLARVMVWKVRNFGAVKFDMNLMWAHMFNLVEVRLQEDCTVRNVMIIDLEYLTIGHIVTFTPGVTMKLAAIGEKVYSNRVQEVHLINCSSHVHTLVTIAKSILKPKLFQRIRTHAKIEDLHEFIPKRILPKDYGGEEKSLAELNDILKKKFVEYQDRFDKLDQLRVNESLRPKKLDNDDILGFYGNFKKLDVD